MAFEESGNDYWKIKISGFWQRSLSLFLIAVIFGINYMGIDSSKTFATIKNKVKAFLSSKIKIEIKKNNVDTIFFLRLGSIFQIDCLNLFK